MSSVRPTKKQRALLDFIEQFIDQHGYSPSYREIMNGCNYNSIATVAVHINNLISRGHLRKRDHSARSLELTKAGAPSEISAAQESSEAWLLAKAGTLFEQAERSDDTELSKYDDLQTIVSALELLGLQSAAKQLAGRLHNLQEHTGSREKIV